MSYYVYILQSIAAGRYYIGSTEDVYSRLKRHNAGHVRSTRPYRPYKIIYQEVTPTLQDAYRREMQIKRYKSGAAFKKLIQS